MRLITYTCGALWLSAISLMATDRAESPSECRLDSCPSAMFVLVERSDLRTLFCSFKILTTRIEKSICIVDKVSGPPQDVPVQNGDTVATIMKKLQKDCRLPGQLRLITKDALRQSKATLDSPCDDAEFMNLAVSPGDFIIIAAVQ